MSDKIVKKVENLPQLTAVKRTDKLIQRVAAYARVSTGKEEQQTSIVAVSYTHLTLPTKLEV